MTLVTAEYTVLVPGGVSSPPSQDDQRAGPEGSFVGLLSAVDAGSVGVSYSVMKLFSTLLVRLSWCGRLVGGRGVRDCVKGRGRSSLRGTGACRRGQVPLGRARGARANPGRAGFAASGGPLLRTGRVKKKQAALFFTSTGKKQINELKIHFSSLNKKRAASVEP